MRRVKYKTYWAYAGKGIPREGSLLDLVLDILYYGVSPQGVLPPLNILNTALKGGGSTGGMSPDTKWRPFEISDAEYVELVQAFLAIDPFQERTLHPYIRFERPIVDSELDDAADWLAWTQRVKAKYGDSKS